MSKHVKNAGVDTDEEVLQLAKTVLENADPAGAKVGKYNIDMRGVRNAQIGDHNTQHNS